MRTVLLLMAIWFSSVAYAEDREEPERLGTGQYVTGGIVGTVVGFGLGHEIQSRYRPAGAVFRKGEAATLGLLVLGILGQTGQGLDGRGGRLFKPLVPIGAVGFLGFKVVEAVHVWVPWRGERSQFGSLRLGTTALASEGSRSATLVWDLAL